jgi:signal transduction histidine kinase
VHDISRQLHPSIIDDLGLVDAMKSECSLFSRRENIDIRFKAENVPSKIPRDTALCLYRVSQEAIRNIKKHARTGKAIVLLTGDNDELVLRVRDQGAGFKLEKAHHKTGLGLASMGERVRLINGKFVVKSEIGAGTTIEVRVPLLEK